MLRRSFLIPTFKPLLATVISLKFLAASSSLAIEPLNTDGDSYPLRPNILLVVKLLHPILTILPSKVFD